MLNTIKQRTLAKEIEATGVAIHSGKNVMIRIKPAEVNTGIIFNRVDLTPNIQIPASSQLVCDTQLNTSLSNNGAQISTVEHILAALAGQGIDNAIIDIDNVEPPVMDGSSLVFSSLIQQAGIKEQGAPKQFIKILDMIEVSDGDKTAKLLPYEGLKFSATISFDHPAIETTEQTAEIDLMQDAFAEKISAARTFGFLSEYEYLKQNNLAKGASLENTVVLDDKQVLNEEGLRFKNEFALHKLLDAIGDLYLLKHNIIGSFVGYKSGHALMHKLREALLSNENAWALTTLTEPTPISFTTFNYPHF